MISELVGSDIMTENQLRLPETLFVDENCSFTQKVQGLPSSPGNSHLKIHSFYLLHDLTSSVQRVFIICVHF